MLAVPRRPPVPATPRPVPSRSARPPRPWGTTCAVPLLLSWLARAAESLQHLTVPMLKQQLPGMLSDFCWSLFDGVWWFLLISKPPQHYFLWEFMVSFSFILSFSWKKMTLLFIPKLLVIMDAHPPKIMKNHMGNKVNCTTYSSENITIITIYPMLYPMIS